MQISSNKKARGIVWFLLFYWQSIGLPNVFGQSSYLSDGIFTQKQANSGGDLYKAHCSHCHSQDFYQGIEISWAEMSVLDYWYRVRGTMPADNPRSLSDIQYLELLAWVLSVNGYPSGEKPLFAKSYLGLIKFGG